MELFKQQVNRIKVWIEEFSRRVYKSLKQGANKCILFISAILNSNIIKFLSHGYKTALVFFTGVYKRLASLIKRGSYKTLAFIKKYSIKIALSIKLGINKTLAFIKKYSIKTALSIKQATIKTLAFIKKHSVKTALSIKQATIKTLAFIKKHSVKTALSIKQATIKTLAFIKKYSIKIALLIKQASLKTLAFIKKYSVKTALSIKQATIKTLAFIKKYSVKTALSIKLGINKTLAFIKKYSIKTALSIKLGINKTLAFIKKYSIKTALSIKLGINKTLAFIKKYSIKTALSIKLGISTTLAFINTIYNSILETVKQARKILLAFTSGLFNSNNIRSLKKKIKTTSTLVFDTLKLKKGLRNGLLTLIVVTLLLLNPFATSFGKSMNKQEFFMYHVKDLLQYSFGDNASADTGRYLATNTYEGQIDGDLFGVAKGKNLVVIQMESVQSMVIEAEYNGQEITPVFNSIIDDDASVYFDNFYCQIGAGNTSDAEFAVNNSLFGSIESYTYQLFQDNHFYGLPKIMVDEGYNTVAFHGYKSSFWNRENIYSNLGFQQFYLGEDYESDNIEGIGGGNIVGISDEAFFHQTIEKMSTLKEPYYSFVITLSNHNPFGLPEALKAIELEEKDENIFGNYLNAVHYGDYCLGEFMKGLKETGIYDDSVFVFYGDHYGLTKADSNISNRVSEWLGEEYTYDEMNRVPMLVHIPDMDINETISISGGQLDLLPTISYLMGVEELNTLYLGQNLFTANVGFAPIQMHMLKGSFIMDDVVFEMSRDGVFKNSKAWDRISKEPLEVDPYYVEYQAAKQAVEVSEFYLYNDMLRKVLIGGEDLNSALNKNQNNQALPRELAIYTFKENSDEEIDGMVEYLNSNKKDFLAINSNKLFTVLKRFEEIYSGKQGVTGSILYVDEVANEEFLEMRSRIVPLMSSSTINYSKLEYIGYRNIIITPEGSGMNMEELECFIDSNDVDGFLVDNKSEKKYRELANNMNVTIYKLEKETLKKQ